MKIFGKNHEKMGEKMVSAGVFLKRVRIGEFAKIAFLGEEMQKKSEKASILRSQF